MHLRVLTSQQVADQLGCSVLTIEEMARSGELPGFKFGRSWSHPIDALEAALNSMAIDQAAGRRKPSPAFDGCEIVQPIQVAKKGRRRAVPPILSH